MVGDWTSKAVVAALLKDQAETAALAMAIQLDVVTPYLSQRQAYDKYGSSIVDRWIEEGLVKKIKDGPANTKVRISRLELECAARASNRPSYFSLRDFK